MRQLAACDCSSRAARPIIAAGARIPRGDCLAVSAARLAGLALPLFWDDRRVRGCECMGWCPARRRPVADGNGVIINLANVVSVRVSEIDSAATGQYL
jgi:hypothetical protein